MDAAAGSIWADPDTPAACLIYLVADRYGVEGLHWLPTTVFEHVEMDTKVKPNPRAKDKYGAALVRLLNPDEFFSSAAGFRTICQGLAADWFDTHIEQPLTPEEIGLGILEAWMIAAPDPKVGEDFSVTVTRMINWVFRNAGYNRLPTSIQAFGVKHDPGVNWGADLSEDPDLIMDAQAGAERSEEDFNNFMRDKVTEMADYLDRLPLRKTNAKDIAEELRRSVR